ncbi:hypothetical protein CROQUDRAFT_133635 [Cronartium quercuum f. sp. fusiforme G11]|uniref:Beta-glucuronidase C-terminal domain-containing protein n=1 Tax=Cronartium quercuum f. sp. fusiforme G11 TaxID=708437 RepID=A0A9P6TAX0_9BASI|nr:hypothetical protein CROQUDRAFT_133635 [Cronartium quercuum f. sp. fusiforme G11]
MHFHFFFLWFGTLVTLNRAAPNALSNRDITFEVCAPTRSVNLVNVAPIGISFEFFTFPDYIREVPSTSECMKNLADALGSPIPSRIGGTTADFGQYDAELCDAIDYELTEDDEEVPKQLTFGPEYIRLASTLPGSVILGLNRKSNNLNNTLEAAKEAINTMDNLHAIEVGNEPEYWGKSAPIAEDKPWTFEENVASELKWQEAISTSLGRKDIVQAGNYLGHFRISELAKHEGNSTGFIKSFGIHSYPQNTCGKSKTNLTILMAHRSIVEYMNRFKPDIEEAAKLNKPAYFSETNSVACGGGPVSPSFGAALWTLDYIIQSLLAGIKHLYFHHGTLGESRYSFWGRFDLGSPYYGVYFAAMALRGIDGISMLDDGLGLDAAYLLTSKSEPVRILLYNSRYRSAIESRQPHSKVKMTIDLANTKIANHHTAQIFRLQASSSEARVDRGQSPTISGIQFENGTCQKKEGITEPEYVNVVDGKLQVLVEDSEAVLIQL